MKIGLLWFDDDKGRTLAEKVERGAAHYAAKYRHAPDCCHVNPAMMEGDELRVNGLVVRPSRLVRLNNFWIGVNDGC